MLRRSSFAAACGVAKAAIPAVCVISKTAVPSLTDCCLSSPYCFRSIPSSANGGDGFLFRRFMQKRSVFNPAIRSANVPAGIMDRLKVMDIARERIRIDELLAPTNRGDGVSVYDAKKLLKLAQLEVLKSRLRGIQRNRISYDEFVKICVEGASSKDLGLGFAKLLDESGSVIVLGNIVFLRPDQATETVESCRGFQSNSSIQIPPNPLSHRYLVFIRPRFFKRHLGLISRIQLLEFLKFLEKEELQQKEQQTNNISRWKE